MLQHYKVAYQEGILPADGAFKRASAAAVVSDLLSEHLAAL